MKLFPVICWQEWQGYGKSHEDREGGEGGERGAFREGSFHAIHWNVHKRWFPFSYKISHSPLFSLFRHNRTIGCTRGWGKEETRKVMTSSRHNALHYDCRRFIGERHILSLLSHPFSQISLFQILQHDIIGWSVSSAAHLQLFQQKMSKFLKNMTYTPRGTSMQKLTEPLVLN